MNGLKHYVPPLPKDAKKPNNIPIDYFERRAEEIYRALRKRIKEVTRSGHNQSDQERELEDLKKLKDDVMACLATTKFDVIRSRGVLNATCGELHTGPIISYKKRKEKLKSIITQLTHILEIERQAINEIFNLPEKFEPQNGDLDKPAEKVVIHLSPEEKSRCETEAFFRRAQKNPERYLQLEKLYEVFLAELNKIIDQLRPLENLQKELKQHFNEIKHKKEKARDNIIGAQEKTPEIKNTLKAVPTTQSLEGLPQNLRDATLAVYRSYTLLFLPVRDFKKACDQTREVIRRFMKDKEAFQAVLSDNKLNFLLDYPSAKTFFGERYGHFMKLKTIFEELVQEIEEASKVVDSSEKEIDSLLKKPNLKNTLSKIIPFVNEGFILVMQQLFESDSGELKSTGKKEEAEEGTETKAREEEGAEQKKKKGRRYKWDKMNPDERCAEIKQRLFNNWKMIQYVVEHGRWGDLRLILERMKDQDLRDLRLSKSCFGNETAPYKTRKELFQNVFPEAYEEGISSDFPDQVNLEGKFFWSDTERRGVRDEVKNRLFKGWPLIRDLDTEERYAEIAELLKFINVGEISTHFKLGASCIGGKNAPYTDIEELVDDIWPGDSQEEESE